MQWQVFHTGWTIEVDHHLPHAHIIPPTISLVVVSEQCEDYTDTELACTHGPFRRFKV